MATHISCPVCGKATVAGRFPAQGPIDLVGLTFRGLGRSRGFTVAGRSSLLDDRGVCRSLAFRLVAVLATLQEHGHFSLLDLPGAQRLAHWERELDGQERDLERRDLSRNQ